MMQPVGFMPTSTSPTPAFAPTMLLEAGMEVGQLGMYLNGCAVAPAAPCGGMVQIGPLLANLTGQSSATTNRDHDVECWYDGDGVGSWGGG
jgi:hypothetical protein